MTGCSLQHDIVCMLQTESEAAGKATCAAVWHTTAGMQGLSTTGCYGIP